MEASQKPEASLSHGDIGMSMEDRTQSAVVEPKKRLIYCSDGVIEEDELLTEEDLIDDWDWLDMMTLEGKPDNMSWLKWSVYKTGRGFGHTLAYLESWGETLAKEFGITEPQYQDVIDLHNRIMEDAGEPITGFPEPLTEPVQKEPTYYNLNAACEKC